MRSKKTRNGVDIKETYGMPEVRRPVPWILLVDDARALVYESTTDGLSLQNELEHPKGRLKMRELVTDRPGRVFPRGDRSGGIHSAHRQTFESPENPKEHEEDLWVEQVVELVDEGQTPERFDSLILVGPTKLLAKVKGQLRKETLKKLTSCIEKDLHWLNGGELEERVAELAGVPGRRRYTA